MNNSFEEQSFANENEIDLNHSVFKTPNTFVLPEKSTPSFSPIYIRRKGIYENEGNEGNEGNSVIFSVTSPVDSSSSNVEDQMREEDEQRQEMTDEERRLKEEAESEALARQLMAEEAMASYHESSNYLLENQDQFSEEDLAALRAIMQEENPILDLEAVGSTEEEEEEVSEELSYDALLRLGERIGDVKTERWKLNSKKEIEKLPQIKYFPTMGHGKCENDSDVKCLVCQFQYEGGDTVRKLPCNHYFHSECVDQWLSEKDHCPYCRQCIVVE